MLQTENYKFVIFILEFYSVFFFFSCLCEMWAQNDLCEKLWEAMRFWNCIATEIKCTSATDGRPTPIANSEEEDHYVSSLATFTAGIFVYVSANDAIG